ncbi:MAG: T9SS type A sorting domain-containing protein [Ignavibacteriae bacterium]|nr:T9SS type A sorting domain-containing protein [Ignavibacteriota bacterium]
MKKIYYLLLTLLFFSSTIFAQSDFGNDSKKDMPNDWGKKSSEKSYNYGTQEKSQIPDYLIEQYRNAKQTRNNEEKLRVGNEIQKYLPPNIPPQEGTYEKTQVHSGVNNPPFNPDWNPSDVTVLTGDVRSLGYRQMDLKYGEDGWQYLAVNRVVSGYNGYISIYRSSNGGLNWGLVTSATNTAVYFGNLTMLVEKRHATINDSVRILLYYNRSGSSSLTDASIEILCTKRDGSGAFALNFGSPPSGHRYVYPTACSDGMYWDVATYMHILAREESNDGNTYYGLRHWLTIDWGRNYTDVLINTFNNDWYPSAAYCEKGTGNDSIYIAVERRINTTEYEIRAIITCEWLTTNHFAYYITSGGSGTKYEKPCITVQQQQANVPRRVMITYTRNNLAKYCISTNGGQSWQVDGNLGTVGLADYTWCNSDSLTAGDGYAIACFVDQNGDSITVRRGNMTGSLGTALYKRNSNPASGVLTPVCAVFKLGTTKYSAFAYAGYGPVNVYYNQEHLPTGITPYSNVTDKFELSQNYPNPFNPTTNIKYQIAKNSFVTLKIYDVLGKEIVTIVNENQTPGSYSIDFNATQYPSGIYFYKIYADNFTDVKKMILMK